MTEYLTVEQEFIKGRKTPVYNVWRTGGIFLGTIHRRVSWRQLVWTQEANVNMSKGCLEELWNKIDTFEKERCGDKPTKKEEVISKKELNKRFEDWDCSRGAYILSRKYIDELKKQLFKGGVF